MAKKAATKTAKKAATEKELSVKTIASINEALADLIERAGEDIQKIKTIQSFDFKEMYLTVNFKKTDTELTANMEVFTDAQQVLLDGFTVKL